MATRQAARKESAQNIPPAVRSLVEEYNSLRDKKCPDSAEAAADKLRMAELLRQIQEAYNKPAPAPDEQKLNEAAVEKAARASARAEEVKKKIKESVTNTGASKVSRE